MVNDDMNDIKSQLFAIVTWLDELDDRLVKDHASLGSKQLRLALGHMLDAEKKLENAIQQQCNTSMN